MYENLPTLWRNKARKLHAEYESIKTYWDNLDPARVTNREDIYFNRAASDARYNLGKLNVPSFGPDPHERRAAIAWARSAIRRMAKHAGVTCNV